VAELTSTGRVRRSGPASTAAEDDWRRSKFRHGSMEPAAPTPVVAAIPRGDLTVSPAETIVGLVAGVWPGTVKVVSERRRAVRALLAHLAGLPGSTWQQRWDASDYADGTVPLRELPGDPRAVATLGLKLVLCLRVLRPSLPGMRAVTMVGYAEAFRAAQADPGLDRFFAHLAGLPAPGKFRRAAAFDVACALTLYGIRFAELTPPALLHYAWECRRYGAGPYQRGKHATFSGQLAWQALRDIGHFPHDVPPTLQAAGQRGPLSITELVDRYPIANRAVRQLLIDYLTRRATTLDYSSLTNLARWLAGVFWSKIEQIAPRQADLRIPGHVYDQWRAAIRLRDNGQPRLSIDPILLSVRSFYLDLHTWSVAEPQRWAAWVAPCPIDPGDFVGSARRHRRVRERSAERTRTRQPLLPLLVDHVTDRLAHVRRLLAEARDVDPGQQVGVDGRSYVRVWTRQDDQYQTGNGKPRIRVHDESTGQLVNVVLAEDGAFWDWAIVETLRLTGIRVEELLELTQLSIRRYTRPNGETIALLVVAPSKSDRERVIPMSAELFAVIAAVIRRHNDTSGGVPAVTRYDTHERVHTPALPFLFQRHRGATRAVFSQAAVLDMLQRRCGELAQTHPEFGQARFTPHDFRRLFATELVNNGLPIHVGAALLGHLNLETTRGYVAVFDEDLVRHYQAYLDRRRQLRPSEEYRPATDTEWVEFEAHFDKRKVELGNCGTALWHRLQPRTRLPALPHAARPARHAAPP
jgi:integrase